MLRVAALAIVIAGGCKGERDTAKEGRREPAPEPAATSGLGGAAPGGKGATGGAAIEGAGGELDRDHLAAPATPVADARVDALDLQAVVATFWPRWAPKASSPPPGPPAGPPSRPPPADVSPRFRAYLAVLSADLYLDELLGVFPGAPAGVRFVSGDYRWHSPATRDLTAVGDMLAAAATHADSGTEDVDAAVAAYAKVAAEVMPPLVALNAYYTTRRFVDDEFDRGRREARLVPAWRGRLAKARTAMWRAVLERWREASFDAADSPRAIVTRAWEACVKVGEAIVQRTDRKRRDAAVSGCRRSIGTVGALPETIRGDFDAVLRAAALALGDQVGRDSAWSFYKIPAEIRLLTTKYLEMWPALPVMPAERAGP